MPSPFSGIEKYGSELCEHTRNKFELEFGTRFNVEIHGQYHWYLESRITQDQQFNITIDQYRYANSIVQHY